MAGKPAGHEEDGIDADVVALAGVTRRQPLGGDRNAPQPVLVEGHGHALFGASRFDLDEGDNAPAAGHQVDFAARHSGALGQDAPAMQPQPPGGEALGAAAPPLRFEASVQRLSSSARA
jgi:hypothetical protein